MKTDVTSANEIQESLDNILKAVFQETGKSRRNEQIPKYM